MNGLHWDTSFSESHSAKWSNSISKTSKDIQTALHRSSLLQSTSSTVSASVSRSLSVFNLAQSFVVLQTHKHLTIINLIKYDWAAQWPDIILDIVKKNLVLDSQTTIQEKPSRIWSGQTYQYLQRHTSPAIFLVKQILPNPEDWAAKMVFQKQHHLMSINYSPTWNKIYISVTQRKIHIQRDCKIIVVIFSGKWNIRFKIQEYQIGAFFAFIW
jgi:G3E family GTPase